MTTYVTFGDGTVENCRRISIICDKPVVPAKDGSIDDAISGMISNFSATHAVVYADKRVATLDPIT
jgi:hypothetical protein